MKLQRKGAQLLRNSKTNQAKQLGQDNDNYYDYENYYDYDNFYGL